LLTTLTILMLGLMWLSHYPYFLLNPGISTQFAPDFNDAGFRQIQIGDSRARVLELVGEPLWGCVKSNTGDPCGGRDWTYSYEKEAFPRFAWFHNGVWFDEAGNVQLMVSEIVYEDGGGDD
jgi:hypothetical protein